MKIVINACYGGFSLSQKAKEYLRFDGIDWLDLKRDDPKLVECVEALGDAASGKYSLLKVVEIPNDVEWEIEEYDGCEWVSEKHRTWG